MAGSEDNRRTENEKERMVESANINKSLFTLAKCVEAISRQDTRVPYRESKMTRILNIGMYITGANNAIPSLLHLQDMHGKHKALAVLLNYLKI